MKRTTKYLKIRITCNTSRHEPESLTLEECGVKVDETYYADVYDHAAVANIRAKRDNADKSILAGDNLSVNKGEFEVVE